MAQSNVRTIRLAKKGAQFFKELSQLFMRITFDETRLHGVFITRVELSNDGGMVYVHFYTQAGEEEFSRLLPILILYKPSLRKALSQQIAARYTPELVFKFDDKFERQSKLEALLNNIKSEDEPSS